MRWVVWRRCVHLITCVENTEQGISLNLINGQVLRRSGADLTIKIFEAQSFKHANATKKWCGTSETIDDFLVDPHIKERVIGHFETKIPAVCA